MPGSPPSPHVAIQVLIMIMMILVILIGSSASYLSGPEFLLTSIQARLARRPAKAEAAPREVEDDGTGEMTDATFDERMRAKVSPSTVSSKS